MTGSSDWLELSVLVDTEAVEPVVEVFSGIGHQGGVVIEEPFLQDGDGENLRIDPSARVMVRTYVPATAFDDRQRDELEQTLWHLGRMRPVGDLLVTPQKNEDWENSWKSHYRPIRVGTRTIVRPPWSDSEGTGSDVEIILDPGMAFGTGTHATTQLCLRLLEDRLQTGDRVLDVGTGSGILAIAAAKFGAGSVDAIEIDPAAARQAAENIRMNGLSDEIDLREGTLRGSTFADSEYDLVLANIVASVLVDLASELAKATTRNGELVLSGIIDVKESRVIEAFSALQMEMVLRNQQEDWVAHIWRRRKSIEATV